MKVPDELVSEAFGELKGLEPLYVHDVERALQAVLPKVRERLLSVGPQEAAFRAAGQKVPSGQAASPAELGTALREGTAAAFDHAFPEEES